MEKGFQSTKKEQNYPSLETRTHKPKMMSEEQQRATTNKEGNEDGRITQSPNSFSNT